jgi:hypothetical protein
LFANVQISAVNPRMASPIVVGSVAELRELIVRRRQLRQRLGLAIDCTNSDRCGIDVSAAAGRGAVVGSNWGTLAERVFETEFNVSACQKTVKNLSIPQSRFVGEGQAW